MLSPLKLRISSSLAVLLLFSPVLAQKTGNSPIHNESASKNPQRAGLEEQRRVLNDSIHKTRLELEQVQQKKRSGLKQLELIRGQIRTREKIIHNYSQDIEMQQNQISELETLIGSLQADLIRLKKAYAQLLRRYHRQMQTESPALLILSAKDVNQALRRSRHLKQYNTYRREQAEAIAELQKEMTQKEKILEVEKSQKEELKTQEEANKQELRKESQQQDQIVKSLQKDEKKLRQELRNQEIARNKLQKRIEDLIRKEIEAARLASSKGDKADKGPPDLPKSPSRNQALLELTPEAKALGKAFEENKGRLPWPLRKALVSEFFGFHTHPQLKNINIRNDGITLRGEKGAEVRGCFRGEVTAVVNIPGMQKTIIIRHGQYLTVYAHLSETTVNKGQKVNTGQILGTLHTRPEDGESFLQFQLWKGTTKVNPLPWLAGK
jgi:septal ring factor EnvC (AmiA/AmiB activator)